MVVCVVFSCEKSAMLTLPPKVFTMEPYKVVCQWRDVHCLENGRPEAASSRIRKVQNGPSQVCLVSWRTQIFVSHFGTNSVSSQLNRATYQWLSLCGLLVADHQTAGPMLPGPRL